MNKYQKYKNSGVQWLGEIPEHWEILPSKRYFYYKKEINKNYISDNVLSLTLRGVVNNDIENPEGLVPKDYATYQYFEKDNLVFKLIDLENVSTSRVGIVHENGIMSSAYIRLISGSKIFNKYAYYFYFSLYKNQVFNKLGSGVRSTLNPTDLLNLSFVKPPLSEQTAIANFLDDKTAKIDQAIAIKEKEITLLKERRQILIQKAVTKGLDPNVKMKDSGVDWIGEIPEHWEVRKLKSLSTKIGDGLHGTPDYDDEGEYYFINGNNLGGNYISVSEITKKVNFNEFKKNRKELSEKSILLSINGTIGNVAFYRNELVMLGKSVCYVNLTNDVNKKFLAFYFKSQSFKEYCEVVLSGSTIYNLSLHSVANTKISLPFLEEQTEIVSYLEKIEEKISKAISLKQQEIEKLKEYKTVLIDNVVTGKVRVG